MRSHFEVSMFPIALLVGAVLYQWAVCMVAPVARAVEDQKNHAPSAKVSLPAVCFV